MSAETMIRSFTAGQQMRQQQAELDRQNQMADLQRQVMLHALKRQDWEDKTKDLMDRAALLTNTPTANLPPSAFQGGQGPMRIPESGQQYDPSAFQFEPPQLEPANLAPLTLPAPPAGAVQ